MPRSITLHNPDETVARYQRGASAAGKPIEQFIIDRLIESVPPAEQLLAAIEDQLREMELIDDDGLIEIVRSMLPPGQSRRYERFLAKNAAGNLSEQERAALKAIGEEARWLTLRKAYAWLILKWRGIPLPRP